MNFGLKLHDIQQRCQKSVLFRRLAGGAFWALIAALGTNFGNLLTGIILAHILGKYTYGQYGMLRTTLNMFIIFSSFSLGATATKYVAEYRTKDKEKVGRIIGLSLITVSLLSISFFLICYFGADVLAVKSLNSADMAPSLKIGAWMILFAVLNSVLTGILSGFESFSCIAKINFGGAILLVVSSIVGAKFWNLSGALVSLSIYLAGMILISIYFLYKELKFYDISIYYKNCFQELSTLWRFSLPTTLGGILVTPVLWFGSTILVKSPAGYDGMAGFDVINQWKMAVLFIPNIFGRIALPMLSNLNGNNQNHDYLTVFKINLTCNVGITLFAAIALSLSGKWILSFYGQAYAEYTLPLIIILIAAVFNAANSIVGHIILSKDYAWIGCIFNVLWGIVFLICAYYLVMWNNFGVMGMAITYAVSYLLHSIWQFIFIYWIFSKNK